jgi:hypothetical protein
MIRTMFVTIGHSSIYYNEDDIDGFRDNYELYSSSRVSHGIKLMGGLDKLVVF